MKVKIYYTLTFETTAEIDDKFKALLTESLTPLQRHKLTTKLLKEADLNIPMEGTLTEVWDNTIYGELLAKVAPYSGPTAL